MKRFKIFTITMLALGFGVNTLNASDVTTLSDYKECIYNSAESECNLTLSSTETLDVVTLGLVGNDFVVSKNSTIDLNSYSLELLSNIIINHDITLNIKNGIINENNDFSIMQNNGNLIVDKLTINSLSLNVPGIKIDTNAKNTQIKESVINTKHTGLDIVKSVKVTIEKTNITSELNAIDFKDGSLFINGGTYYGKNSAITTNSSNLTIFDGTFNGETSALNIYTTITGMRLIKGEFSATNGKAINYVPISNPTKEEFFTGLDTDSRLIQETIDIQGNVLSTGPVATIVIKGIEMGTQENYITWKNTTDTTWNNLISIDTLKGRDGKDGKDGLNGKDGKDGVSITDVKIDSKGYLQVTLSDQSVINAGLVKQVINTTNEITEVSNNKPNYIIEGILGAWCIALSILLFKKKNQ